MMIDPTDTVSIGCRRAVALAALRVFLLPCIYMACVLCAGCMSTEAMAPSVGEDFISIVQRRDVSHATLEMGRQIYLGDCSRCHSIEPIGRYSEEHWHKILPRMIQRTKLEAQRGDAVTKYIFSAHEVIRTRAAGGSGE